MAPHPVRRGGSVALSSRLTQTLDDGGVGHAAAPTHRLQRVPAAALLESVDHGGHNASAAGIQRMSDRDSAAVDVGRGESATVSLAQASTIDANT
jgi:hypothetical protein